MIDLYYMNSNTMLFRDFTCITVTTLTIITPLCLDPHLDLGHLSPKKLFEPNLQLGTNSDQVPGPALSGSSVL